jgi:hypothetical protein
MDDEVEIRIPDIAQTEDGQSLAIEHRLDTAEFSSLVMDLVQRTFKVCDEALQQADVIARDLDGVILVGGPTRLPLIRQAVSDYFQQEPKADVDPDEVVAMGAAIHAAALSGDSPQDAFLLDVTPLSLRIGVAGGLAEPVIERNTPVPIEQTRGFTTFKDGQESVQIRVYQGESRQADENEMLGQFEFSGFRKARRGEARIEVTFEIDTNGIVNVTARDPETGKATSAEISLSSGLSETEIDQILETANTDRVTGERGPELETDEDDLAATDDDDLAMVSNEPPEPAVVLKPAPVAEAAPMEARAASPAERVIEPDEDDEMDITLDPTPPEMREVAAPAMGRVLEPELDASDPELEVDVEIEPSPTVSSATRDDAVDPLASTSGELEIDPATLAAGMDEPLPDEPAGAQGSDPAPEPGAAQTVEEALPDIELGDDDLAMLGSDGEVQDDAPLFGNVGTDLSDYHDDKDER